MAFIKYCTCLNGYVQCNAVVVIVINALILFYSTAGPFPAFLQCFMDFHAVSG